MTYAEPLSGMIGAVARELLGNPNKHMSREADGVLRFGNNGSIEVNTAEGWFSDYETKVSGGTLDLLAHKGGIADHASAFRWLEERGIKEPSNDTGRPGPTFYEYADEAGAVLFKVERRQTAAGKTFVQHGPDGQGGFVCRKGCMQGVRRVLYRLPELIAADPAAIVFVCEGEKDADRLGGKGLVATTNPGGAGKFLREFAPMLAGRRVVVLEDNDQAGRDHAADVKAKLEGIAAEVAVLRLPGGDKSDVSDWLNNGGSAFDLHRLALEVLAKAGPDLLPSLDLAALATVRAKPVEFAIERIVPVGEVTLFTGPGSAGKSLLAQQLCTVAAAAMGSIGGVGTCLGLGVKAGPAIYVTCEDTGEHLHFRQERLCEALGVDMASLAGKLRLVSLRGELGNELEGQDDKGGYAPSAAYHRLAATIKATGAKLVALDNVAHLFAGNENDRHDVTRFVNLLNRLARDTGAAIILIGHPNKSGDTYSGSTAWLNAVRSQIWIDCQRDADGSVLDRDARVLTIGKANYAPKGDGITFRWHQWAFVLDEDLPPDTRSELAEVIKANGENAAFLRCLASATDRQRAVSHNPGSNYAPKVFANMPEGKSHTTKAFAAAMERLLHLGTIALDQPLWRGPNRVMKQGIRLSENCTAPPAPTPCTNPPETPGNPARFNPPSTTYNGAGPDGPPPLGDDDLDWGTDGEDEE